MLIILYHKICILWYNYFAPFPLPPLPYDIFIHKLPNIFFSHDVEISIIKITSEMSICQCQLTMVIMVLSYNLCFGEVLFWRSTDEILIILDQKSFIWWSDLFGKYFVFSFINFVFVFVFFLSMLLKIQLETIFVRV